MSRPLLARLRENRRAVIGSLLILISGIGLLLYLPQLRDYYQHLYFLQQRDSTVFYLSFSALLLLATLTSIFPASILGVFAGLLFGLIRGVALSAGTLMLGAFLAFVFSRYFFRSACRRLVAKVFDLERFENKLRRYGWRYALVLRLAPLAPFSITSYALALTPLSLRQYLLSTLASLPFLVVCVYLGSVGGIVINTAGNVDERVLWRLVLEFSIAAAAVAVIMVSLPRLARRLLTPGKD